MYSLFGHHVKRQAGIQVKAFRVMLKKKHPEPEANNLLRYISQSVMEHFL